jgi:hypothetical protein
MSVLQTYRWILIPHAEVRTLPPRPGNLAFGSASHEDAEMGRKPHFSGIGFGLRAPSSPSPRRKSPKVSGLVRGNSRFAETIPGEQSRSRLQPDRTECSNHSFAIRKRDNKDRGAKPGVSRHGRATRPNLGTHGAEHHSAASPAREAMQGATKVIRSRPPSCSD